MPSLDTEIWILHKFHLSHNIVIIFPLGEFSLFLLLLAIGLHQKNMSPDLICKLCFAGKGAKKKNEDASDRSAHVHTEKQMC